MRKLILMLLTLAFVTATPAPLTAQPGKVPGKQKQKDFSASSIVTRMMAFNKKQDGKLTKDEVTDARLHRLFDLADTNKDGEVTREELTALAAKLDAEYGPDTGGPKGKAPGGPGGKGPGGKGPGGKGPDGKGPGGPKGKGPGGAGGPGGAPQPGQIMPQLLQNLLNLTSDQKKQLSDLQKDVDGKLDKILTDQQKTQLKEIRERGPGGPRGSGQLGPPELAPAEGLPAGKDTLNSAGRKPR